MKKILLGIVVLSALFLAGCDEKNKQYVTVTKNVVVVPPDSMYKCPVLRYVPKGLTTIQFAKLFTEAVQNNLTCHSSLEAIRAFELKAKATIK